MEENNFNNETYEAPIENIVAPEAPVEVSIEEPVVEAFMPETKVEEIAQENSIEASISAPEPEVTAITSSDLASSSTEQALGSVANGIIGVTTTVKQEKPNKQPYNKVCIYSQKNIHVPGLGKLLRGYQMLDKTIADQWLDKPYARIATPEEVAREFRK